MTDRSDRGDRSDRREAGERDRAGAAPLRLFVGARVSLATVRALEEAARALQRAAEQAGVRASWVAPATYHVTLRFLGWTRPEVVAALRDRVGAALRGARGFELEVRGLGAFPSAERARVLWAGVDAAAGGRLTDLAARIDRAAVDLGFPREKRAYHGHVTLARLKAASDVGPLLRGASDQTFRQSLVESAILFESKTKPTGSEYTPLASWALEADPKAVHRHRRPVEQEVEGDLETDELGPQTGPEKNDDGDQH